MRFQVDRENLVEILQKVHGIATSKKSTLAILSHVMIEAETDDKLVFSVTDLDISLRVTIQAAVEEPGKTTVSARKLLEISKELYSQSITFELKEDGRLILRAGRSVFKLATIGTENFPFFNFPEQLVAVSCDAQLIRRALQRTGYAIPGADNPFFVSGLNWKMGSDGKIRLLASDGHRLAVERIEIPDGETLMSDETITIPKKGIQEMVRVLEKESEMLLGIDENRLLIQTKDAIMSIQLLEDEFPDYETIIPGERPHHFVINREVFLTSLRRLLVLTDQTWKHVQVTVSDNALELIAGNPELGQATDSLDVDYTDDPFTIAFNIRYMHEAVQNLGSEEVRMEWMDEFHGCVLLEPDNPDYLAFIMPIVV